MPYEQEALILPPNLHGPSDEDSADFQATITLDTDQFHRAGSRL